MADRFHRPDVPKLFELMPYFVVVDLSGWRTTKGNLEATLELLLIQFIFNSNELYKETDLILVAAF
jgi:hypothetical protein